MDKITMTKDGATKFVTDEAVKSDLLADGWTVEGEEAPARRGRPAKTED